MEQKPADYPVVNYCYEEAKDSGECFVTSLKLIASLALAHLENDPRDSLLSSDSECAP